MTAFLAAIAVYTPMIQFLILYCYAYRHEPFRLLHSKRERTGLNIWVKVFSELRLTDNKQSLTAGEGNRIARFLMIFLVPSAIISAALSLFEPLMMAGSFIVMFQLPLLFLLQFVPALSALVVLERRMGPRPLSPYTTIIPDSHGSSLVRHLGETKVQLT